MLPLASFLTAAMQTQGCRNTLRGEHYLCLSIYMKLILLSWTPPGTRDPLMIGRTLFCCATQEPRLHYYEFSAVTAEAETNPGCEPSCRGLGCLLAFWQLWDLNSTLTGAYIPFVCSVEKLRHTSSVVIQAKSGAKDSKLKGTVH